MLGGKTPRHGSSEKTIAACEPFQSFGADSNSITSESTGWSQLLFRRAMELLGVKAHKRVVDDLFRAFDTDKSGELELRVGISARHSPRRQDTLRVICYI